MDESLLYRILADAVLLIHFAIVIFVVSGLPLIIIGNLAGWSWVNRFWFRLTHLAIIIVVVLQAWLGQYCSLTELESWLRVRAGETPYAQSFIAYWLQRALYYEAPFWFFSVAYTAFALLVVWIWWRYPPLPKDKS